MSEAVRHLPGPLTLLLFDSQEAHRGGTSAIRGQGLLVVGLKDFGVGQLLVARRRHVQRYRIWLDRKRS